MSRRGVSRREFMRLAGTSALSAWPAAALAGGLPQAAQLTSPGPLLQVALVPCPDYGPETLAAAIRTGWRSSRPPMSGASASSSSRTWSTSLRTGRSTPTRA